jgi:hypothetical protein
MSQKQRGLVMVALLLIGALMLSACELSLSQPPAITPTLIPTGLFVSPFPSVENPMQMIEEFARQTSAAQTALASGGTPAAPGTVTTGTVLTPQTGSTPTPPSGTPSTPTNVVVQCTPPPACPAGQTLTCPAGGNCPGGCGVVCAPITATYTPITPGARPGSYRLEKGEWPYCIARRFNVNPNELLSLSGLTTAQSNALMPGQNLNIPQTGNPFPGDRSWHDHPDTYSVSSSDQTVFGVACYYRDIEPAVIANANGISVSSSLSVGQKLTIP